MLCQHAPASALCPGDCAFRAVPSRSRLRRCATASVPFGAVPTLGTSSPHRASRETTGEQQVLTTVGGLPPGAEVTDERAARKGGAALVTGQALSGSESNADEAGRIVWTAAIEVPDIGFFRAQLFGCEGAWLLRRQRIKKVFYGVEAAPAYEPFGHSVRNRGRRGL